MKALTKNTIEKELNLKVYGNYVMIDGVLYPLPLVQGNEKLGKIVWHSSTLPTNKEFTIKDKAGNVHTEKGTCPLTCKGCYGTTGNYRFNTTKYALMMRTRLLRQHMDIYFKLVDIQLRCENIKKLRIHAVGDFIKGEAIGFYNVLLNHPEVKAWTYTKVKNDDDIKTLDSLKNCNVVKSIIPCKGFNFGTIPYIGQLYYYLKRLGKSVYICRCGIDKNQHCSDCDGCSTHEYVLFIIHSTGYNPKKDYGYDKMVALINSQD